ncbi:MAG: hypothetical protein ACLGSH_05560 [Acidobacteriota bacterium]
MLPLFPLLILVSAVPAQTTNAPLPDISQLMRQVEQHQHQVEAMRENYTFDCLETTQEIGAAGQVKNTATEQRQEFFVNGHMIGRVVKKDGQALNTAEEQKEDARVKALVEKAEQTPPDQRLQGRSITVGRVLELMDLRSPRREVFRGRPTLVLDFAGRRDAKTHGMMEDASKKLAGTVWIDEKDLQVAHLEVRVDNNFRIGGLLASVQKGSSFRFDQAPVDHGLWLPTGSEAYMQAKVLLLKSVRERKVQKDFGFRRFEVVTPAQVSEIRQPEAPSSAAGEGR